MRRTAIFVGAFLVVAAPIAETAFHVGADRAAQAEFTTLAERSPDLRAAKVTADPWRRNVTIESLSVRRAGLVLRVGRITVPFAAPRSFFASPAYAQDAEKKGTIFAENIEIDAGAVHYAIKRIDLSGTSLTKADLDSILDPKSALSVADRIGKFSASEINIPEIVMATTLSGQTEKDTYRDIALDDVVEGRVRKATIGSLSSDLVSPTAGTMQSAYGPIKMTGVDLALAARIVSEARQSDAEPRKTLYERVDIEGGKIFIEKSHLEIGIGALSAKDVKGRPLRIPPTSAAGIFAAQDAKSNPQVAAYLADVLDSFEIGALELTDLHYTITQDTTVSGTLSRVYVERMAMSKIAEAGVENFAVESAGSSVKIGGLAFRDIDLSKLRDAMADGAKAGDAAASDASVPVVDEILLTGLAVEMANGKADAPAQGGGRTRFQIAKIDLTSTDPVDGIPTHFSTVVDHFTLDLKNTAGGQFGDLVALGYDKLDMSSRIEARFDASKRELGLDDFSLSGIDMGELKIAGTFENVTKDLFSSDQAKIEAAALVILVRRIEIRLENAGLFERLIAAAAKKDNKSPDEIREKYTTAAAIGVPALLGNGPGATAVGAAIAKFIATPRNLRIVMVAPAGLGASDLVLLKDPGALLDKLSIEAAANE